MEIRQIDTLESTLDESVYDTFMRDINVIWAKVKIVFLRNVVHPDVQKHIDDWDLWGPLLLGVLFSLFSSDVIHSKYDSSVVFATLLVVQWLGAVVIAVNAKLLKMDISYFQMACALGYSLIPVYIFSVLISVLNLTRLVKFILQLVGVMWSMRTMNVFLSKSLDNSRRALVLFPALLYFLFFASIIM